MKIQPQKSMKGTVVAVGSAGKAAVVQTVFGQFSMLELKNGSGQLGKGDIVRGYLESLGNETIVNETRDTVVKVVFKETKTTRDRINQFLKQ